MYTIALDEAMAEATYLDVTCLKDHCDLQGKTHRLELSMYADEHEARAMVAHSIDLGGVFHVDCIADGYWSFFTNHDQISENEIQWWIEQANAAAKLCADLNKEIAG